VGLMEYATGELVEDVIRRHPQGRPPKRRSSDAGASLRVGYCTGPWHRASRSEAGNLFATDGVVKGATTVCEVHFVQPPQRSDESIGTVHYMAPRSGQW